MVRIITKKLGGVLKFFMEIIMYNFFKYNVIILLILFFPLSTFAKVRIVATTPNLAAIAKEITKVLAEVSSLSQPTEDPHYVDPRPNLILDLNKADLLIVNGLELEAGWLLPLIVQSRNPKIQKGGDGYFDASQFVTLKEVPTSIDRSKGDIHPGGNPHYTLDPNAAVRIAKALSEKLSLLDEQNKKMYQNCTQAFSNELETFTKFEETRFLQILPEKRQVVSYHKSLIYLFDWLHLSEVATIEPKPGISPDPAHTAHVLQIIKKNNVKLIIQEEYYPRITSKTLADLSKGKLIVLHGGARCDTGERYIDHLKKITDDLYHSLQL